MTAQRMATSPIERSTLASILTERLREALADGTLRPGSRLSEVELASTFGVSRGPVREAIQRLVHEGLLRNGPGRRAVVPVLSHHDVRDIYLARAALEATAVRHIIATGKADQAADELDRLVGLMQESAAADDWQAVRRFDLEFHTALVAATGSERLQRMFSTVIFETRLCLRVLTAAEARNDLAGEHRQIAAMIREGRTDEALRLLTKHFEDAIATIVSRNNRTVEDRK